MEHAIGNALLSLHPQISSPKHNHNNNNNNNLENKKNENNIIINKLKFYPYDKNRKRIVKQIIICLLCGIIIIGFVYFISNETQKNEIKNALSFLSIFDWILICCFILIILIIILIYNNNKEKTLYKTIASEDFEILKNSLYENFRMNKGKNNTLFQNEFIKKCCEKRNIEEEKYIKYIFPLINELIENFNKNYNKNINIEDNLVIKESEINSSGKNWNFGVI